MQNILRLIYLSLFLSLHFDNTVGAEIQANIKEADVCIYGATPSGILAAIAVKREGKSVLIVEPGRWVGGILGAGLKPLQDMSNYDAVGGKTRELMVILGSGSIEDSVIKTLAQEPFGKYRGLMEKMSPKDIRQDFLRLIDEYHIEVVYDHRVNYTIIQRKKIKEVLFDLAPFDEYGVPPAEAKLHNNLKVKAAIFIDASYEGELMARSGVSNRIGRESILEYNEEFAGVRPIGNITPISPFVEPDNPDSGLLPMVEYDHGKGLGAGDHYTQAFNYRFYVTSDPKRRVPISPPDNYDPSDYELVGRCKLPY